jgi:hypothetical protein
MLCTWTFRGLRSREDIAGFVWTKGTRCQDAPHPEGAVQDRSVIHARHAAGLVVSVSNPRSCAPSVNYPFTELGLIF